MIRHYVARRAKVIEDHPQNAADCSFDLIAERDEGAVPGSVPSR